MQSQVLLELCRASQHFDDGTSKCKGTVKREDSQIYLRKTEREFLRWWNIKIPESFEGWTTKTEQESAEICRICAICVPLGHSQRIASTKNLLHPNRRMAWKILQHGVAVNFLSPRKKTQQSLRNKHVPINFYKISKNNSVFILLLQNKVIPLQRNSKQNNNH